jgi:hypothetical protein
MDDEGLIHWLALREGVDAEARSERLTRLVADATSVHDPLHVLDLATGTGSNIRYLANRLPARRQRWLGVDVSATLLTRLPLRMPALAAAPPDSQIETRQMNLAALDDPGIFARRHLVTASALLDLVSEAWLQRLAAHCRAAGVPAALFTLTYDGRSSCAPFEPEDDVVRDLFNRHQRTDKGLGGIAAGPDAAGCAVRAFAGAGYRVDSEPSDWVLGADDSRLQRELIDGWARAATEIAPDQASTIAGWRRRRLEHLDAGRSRVIVGHQDVAAWLPDATNTSA